MAVVLQSMTAVRLCSQLHRQLGEVDSTKQHQRQLAQSQRILTSWHQTPQSSAMGILFTKLWRLFNHQGKNGAVTFIMKLTKTWEISGLDGQKRPAFKDRSTPLLAFETAFKIRQYVAKSCSSIIISFAVTLFLYTFTTVLTPCTYASYCFILSTG